jgi:pSer/pThr/pTyr-binding forkhead associated (FHA) protein
VIRVGDFECRIDTNVASRLDATDYAGSTARLNLAARDGRSVVKDVLRPATLVGALVGCNIQLVGPGISAVHCLITLHRGRLRVRDLRTGQGTRLNSRAVSVGTLNHGDVLQIGSFSARVETSLAGMADTADD